MLKLVSLTTLMLFLAVQVQATKITKREEEHRILYHKICELDLGTYIECYRFKESGQTFCELKTFLRGKRPIVPSGVLISDAEELFRNMEQKYNAQQAKKSLNEKK